MANKNNIVINGSQGYGYNYASLPDIAKQGFEIPKMKTGTDKENLKDYIYYYDSDTKQWERGAEIVIISSHNSSLTSRIFLSLSLMGFAGLYPRTSRRVWVRGFHLSVSMDIFAV